MNSSEKKCNKCGKILDISMYSKNKGCKGGRLHVCKNCCNEYNKKYIKENKETLSRKKKEKYNENIEEERYKARQRYWQNVHAVRERNRNYYLKNYEYNKERCKKRYYERRKEYIEKAKKSGKFYRRSFLLFNSKSKLRKNIEYYEPIKESKDGYLMAVCTYCGRWFTPKINELRSRYDAICQNREGSFLGAECRLYCSEGCKQSCPTYNRILYPKGYKLKTSVEVSSQLRKLVFDRDNYICQKCGTHKDELQVSIHCHHIKPKSKNVIEANDIDNCITLCKDCHEDVHKLPGCTNYDLQCKAV
ncbi:MAG: HNH endonuclease [Clostridiales bacterium]|nr:HNH endonuclease [Clostridiales bacterium]